MCGLQTPARLRVHLDGRTLREEHSTRGKQTGEQGKLGAAGIPLWVRRRRPPGWLSDNLMSEILSGNRTHHALLRASIGNPFAPSTQSCARVTRRVARVWVARVWHGSKDKSRCGAWLEQGCRFGWQFRAWQLSRGRPADSRRRPPPAGRRQASEATLAGVLKLANVFLKLPSRRLIADEGERRPLGHPAAPGSSGHVRRLRPVRRLCPGAAVRGRAATRMLGCTPWLGQDKEARPSGRRQPVCQVPTRHSRMPPADPPRCRKLQAAANPAILNGHDAYRRWVPLLG